MSQNDLIALKISFFALYLDRIETIFWFVVISFSNMKPIKSNWHKRVTLKNIYIKTCYRKKKMIADNNNKKWKFPRKNLRLCWVNNLSNFTHFTYLLQMFYVLYLYLEMKKKEKKMINEMVMIGNKVFLHSN